MRCADLSLTRTHTYQVSEVNDVVEFERKRNGKTW